MSISVSAIHTYPVKSCAPLTLEAHDELAMTPYGLAFDREWMVTRPNGSPLTQRQHPELAVVNTAIENDKLIVTAPRLGSIAIDLERDMRQEAAAQDITLFKKTGTGYDEGDEVAKFFSEHIGRAARLTRSAAPRPVNEKYTLTGASQHTRFADGFPLLLTSVASLRVLDEHTMAPVLMNRFRANVIVDGADLEPYAEDTWHELYVGDIRMFVVRACARCTVPDVNQRRGERDITRPVTAGLQATRSGSERDHHKNGQYFGQNVVHVFEHGQTIAIGDPVTIKTVHELPNVRLDG